MMIKDFIETIKAKLYDFYYNPFLISVFISWLIINREYLLIYFSDSAIKTKLELLENYDFSLAVSLPNQTMHIPMFFCLILPILLGLMYVYLYPLFAIRFYEYTLGRNKKLREAKQKIENETLLSIEESRMIRLEIIKMGEESKSKDDKISLLSEQLKKEDESKDNEISLLTEQLKEEKSGAILLKKELEEIKKIVKMNETEKQKSNLETKKEHISIPKHIMQDEKLLEIFKKIVENISTKNKNILKYLFQTNPKNVHANDLTNHLYRETKIAKVQIENYLEILKQYSIISAEWNQTYKDYMLTLTNNGKVILLALEEQGLLK